MSDANTDLLSSLAAACRSARDALASASTLAREAEAVGVADTLSPDHFVGTLAGVTPADAAAVLALIGRIDAMLSETDAATGVRYDTALFRLARASR